MRRRCAQWRAVSRMATRTCAMPAWTTAAPIARCDMASACTWQRRKHAIAHTDIIAKIRDGKNLNAEEREAALYLLKSVQASQEDWNYLAIFVLSIVTIALDLLLPGK